MKLECNVSLEQLLQGLAEPKVNGPRGPCSSSWRRSSSLPLGQARHGGSGGREKARAAGIEMGDDLAPHPRIPEFAQMILHASLRGGLALGVEELGDLVGEIDQAGGVHGRLLRRDDGDAAGAAVAVVVFWSILSGYFTMYENDSGNAAETLTGRTAIWAVAFSMSLEHPWIGHGLYSFRALMPAFGAFQPWHAHNELLQQFFEFGLLGVAVTIGAYLALFRAGRRSRERSYGKLAWVLMIFCAIHGLADTANFGLSLPLWLFAAHGACCRC